MELLERLAAAIGDRYRIERELGRGGMAGVFLAEDLKHRRRVAIKLLKPELSAALGSERFLREIEIAATLQHPHILPLYDSGEAGGLLYYVMPFAEGESLRQRLAREQQLPLGAALQITREVGSALQYAHAHGVVHRDIKPENIMLSADQAVVADFGIARALHAANTEQLTLSGMVVGRRAARGPAGGGGRVEIRGRADGEPGHPAASRVTAVAVLPFQDLASNADSSYLAEGMTEGLIADLAEIGSLKVISRSSGAVAQAMARPLAEVASELGVESVVQGAIGRVGDTV